MQFKDLREFIRALEEAGEIKVIEGASCDLEIGGVSQIAAESPKSPALLFGSIKGFPKGHRVLTNAAANRRRERLVFDIPEKLSDKEAVKYWKGKIKEYKPIAPEVVARGALCENELRDDKVDLTKIPWPKWHEQDELPSGYGIMLSRNPQSSDIHAVACSFGLVDQRAMVADVPWAIADPAWKKYSSAGKPCPVAISLGHDPALLVAAGMILPSRSSAYDFAGWLRGVPVEVIKGEYADVAIPATGEVVLEGDLLPPAQEKEGAGASAARAGKRKAPQVNVKRMCFRNDPIVVGNPPFLGGRHGIFASRSIAVWNELEAMGIPNIVAVNHYSWGVTIVAIKQPYPGHMKRVAHALLGGIAGQNARFIILVDEDIDPYNLEKVFWAIVTRYDPASALDIVRRIWSDETERRITADKRSGGDYTGSTAIIDACKPYHWMDKFPRTTDISDELLKKTAEKWGRVLRQHG